ncbi:MAG TPA: T9SS type A sorting domain-containing protein, partial [Chitinophagaceae bacterium]|nr:T9SS type A sorting domain-containing protein [Chitinophagaceae bacterium]
INNHPLNFTTPFTWNGTDNLILEFSYTNNSNGIDYTLQSDTTNYISGLFANQLDYYYEFAGNSFINLGNPNFNGLNDKITISFWSNGNQDFLPKNTTLLHAVNAQNNRKINIHFPWENSRFYWDCGAIGGSYDRIDKAATNDEVKGTWNYWAFTKDATTGVMNVYKNGTLWNTGTSKTKTFNDITNIVVGNIQGKAYPYYGKIDELSIWNEQLSQSTIQDWMGKTISPSHPNYANLFAYYRMNEGAGNIWTDLSTQNINSPIIGTPLWRIFKGNELFKNFSQTNNRPKVTFVVGNCNNIIIDTIFVFDSTINLTNTVYTYAIQNNDVVTVDSNVYYQAGYSYVYDENTNTKIDSVLNVTVGNIQITQLSYYKVYPSIFQLNSFVTPYGINLDLGMQGKTWVFDVTDYAPILQGKKRMFIDGGGERQEDMDIKFVHIVGTPPHNVVDIQNIWKVSNAGYTSIMNNSTFEPRNVLLNPNAVSYKIRSAITGHGQEGEFIPQNHYINIDGGAKEFTWNVWKKCALNPVYPQGGTWIYDRAGWCPGMATNIEEMDITPFVTPGTTHNIDYGIDTAWGSSNYWVSNTLVSYGQPNFSLDAAIIDIKNPTTKVEYARTNPICSSPLVTIRNNGSTPLTSLQIDYWVNGNPNHETYTWNGNLEFMESADVSLPFSDNLWSAVSGPNDNQFHVEISSPNQGADMYQFNNQFSSIFNITNIVPADFILWFKTNSAATESKYEIIDQNGQQVFFKDNLANNTHYRDTLHLGWGCYKLIIHDSDEDGLSFFANNDGAGFARLRTLNNGNIINFATDFGHSIEYNFTVDYPLSYDQLYKESLITVYPNPASNIVNVHTDGVDVKDIAIYNQTGQKQNIHYTQQNHLFSFDTQHLAKGIYFVKVISNNNTHVKKIVIE